MGRRRRRRRRSTYELRGKEDEQREVSLAARAYDHCPPPVSRRSLCAGGTVPISNHSPTCFQQTLALTSSGSSFFLSSSRSRCDIRRDSQLFFTLGKQMEEFRDTRCCSRFFLYLFRKISSVVLCNRTLHYIVIHGR
ncbi:hypothetical protein QLX08_003966 [Tetragonisca angustula]|uniref:Uncharacterized protein n=1 Tax=Tetragonisca angustula TaxID=166442 RepID=A0AAW1A7F3_9HYME